MPDPLAAISTRRTAQSDRADARQERNAAGGFTFTIDDTARIRRFISLGVDSGTFYTGERELTRDNAGVLLPFATNRASELVDIVVEISIAGRAPRQNPGLFALAAAASLGDEDGRRKALDALPSVARTGTALFQFAGYCEQFRGWGRGLRRAVANWYTERDVDRLAYQVVKYRQRGGWTHRDLLRLSHPIPDSIERDVLYKWVTGVERAGSVHPLVDAYLAAQSATTAAKWVELIHANSGLSWEMLPDAALGEPDVWDALIIADMPQTALMRQLPRLTRLGVLSQMGTGSAITGMVARQLADPAKLKAARVHPVSVLMAQRTYASGHGARGQDTWSPVAKIVDALDAAFYAAYGAVEPANKRTLIALDVSGSMTAPISGMPLSAREASAAITLVTAATEAEHQIVGFTSGRSGYNRFTGTELSQLSISPRQRLDDVVRYVDGLSFGATDCSLPMQWALQNRVEVDTFLVATDNETWSGQIHPHQALREYREQMGIDARLVVLAMTSTGFSIADPTDPGMLDIAGLDSAVPNLIADFSRGSV